MSVGRSAWLAVGSVVGAAGLGWGTLQAVGLLAHEERTEQVVLDAAPIQVLDVVADGSIRVVAADVEEITITARVSDGLRRAENDHRVVGHRLVVRGSCPTFDIMWCGVGYTIEVPPGTQVVARSENGRIELTGVAGDVDAESDNGSVVATDLSGSARLVSTNGSVRGTRLSGPVVDADSDNGAVLLEFADAPQAVSARSDNGRVDVVVPRTDVLYRVDISASNGSEVNDVRTDPESERSMTVHSDNGDVSIRYAG